jgi:putative transposase
MFSDRLIACPPRSDRERVLGREHRFGSMHSICSLPEAHPGRPMRRNLAGRADPVSCYQFMPLAALRMALVTREPAPGLIQHTNRGSQYLSAAYRSVLAEHQVQASVGRPGTAYGNALTESFFATLRTELLYRHVWRTRQAAKTAIFVFVES